MSDKQSLPFTSHLRDLRNCIVKIILSIFVGFFVCWFFKEILMDVIRQPIAPYLTSTEGNLIFTNPIEKFLSYIKVVFFAATLISCPYWLFQIWKFISPGLYKEEKKWSLIFVVFGSLLFLLGVLFVYFVVFRMAFQFLLLFGGSGELPYISLKEYVAFFVRTSFVFGLVFETPLILSFLIKLKILTVEQLKASRSYVVVIIAFLSALVTPPDVLSMLFLMVPMYFFFEASLWIGKRI